MAFRHWIIIIDSNVGPRVSGFASGVPWYLVPAGTRESMKEDLILSMKAAGDSSPRLYLMLRTLGKVR